jgi:hypothetical protein
MDAQRKRKTLIGEILDDVIEGIVEVNFITLTRLSL